LQRDLIIFQHQSALSAELNLRVVSSAIQNLLTVLVVDRSVMTCAAFAQSPLNRVPVALVAAVWAVWVWHRLSLTEFNNAASSKRHQ
jgi:hypothetical protein